MKVSTQPYKGARDFYPEDKRVQKWLFDKWRRVVERYGYEEYDAPILEPTDLYLMKGSEEIVQEQTYTFKDRGDRSVTIRTEMTPTVSRMVAGRRQELTYPVRWYSIPNLWRYERMQRGRLREFWQLNVDMFGVANEQAETEMIQIIDDLFQAFKAKRSSYVIKINSRLLVIELFKQYGMDKNQSEQLVRLIDRMNKTDLSIFTEMMTAITKDKVATAKLLQALGSKSIEELPPEMLQTVSVKRLQQVLGACKQHGITNLVFDIALMRGFDYYTDIVFEAFDTDPENGRSLLGGGRYDGLVGQFGVEPVPTVGFAVGDVGFMNFLTTHKLLPAAKHHVEATLLIREGAPLSDVQKTARELREMGMNVAVDFTERKIEKQFKAALKAGTRFAIFVGEEELYSQQFILKDLKTGKEEKHSLQRIVSLVKDTRKK